MNKRLSRIFPALGGEINPQSEEAKRARNLMTVGAIYLIIDTFAGLTILVFLLQKPAWQLAFLLIASAIVAFLSGLVFVLARRGQTDRAVLLMMGSIFLGVLSMAAVIQGLGMILGIALTLGLILLATISFPPAALNRAVIFILASAMVTTLAGVFLQPIQLKLSVFQTIITALAGLVIVIFFVISIRQFSSYPLFAKLLLVILLVTLLPIIAITYTNTLTTRQNLTENANRALNGAAVETSERLDGFVTDNLTLARTLAQLHILQEYLLLPAHERLGSETEARLKADLLAFASRDQIYVTSVGLMDIRGVDVADSALAEVGDNKSDRDYFKMAVQTGLPYASTVQISKVLGQPSIFFSAPVRNANGKIIGVLRIRYNAAILQQLMIAAVDDFGIEGSDAILFDEHHIHLADSDAPDLLLTSLMPLPADTLAQLQAERRLPAGTAEELSINLPEFEQSLSNSASQSIFSGETHPGNLHTEQIVAAGMDTQPWKVVISQTQDTYLAPIASQTRNSLVVALVVAGLVSMVAFFVGQVLSRPIVQLTNVAQQIAGGDFTARAPVRSGDETGQLASAFNNMANQLTITFQTLDRRAAELATVAEVGTATATILKVDQLLQEVVNLTKERFHLYHSHIYLLDEEGKNLVLTAGAGEPGRIMVAEERSIPLDREQSLVARAARERKGVTVNDVTQAPDFLPNPLLPDTRSELAVPMIVGGNVIGVFDIQSDQAGRFTDSDVNIQTTLAAQLATSIQNVRSFEQSRKQAELETMVNVIGQKIQRTTSIEETLQTAIRELGTAVGASRVKANLVPTRQGDGTTASRN